MTIISKILVLSSMLLLTTAVPTGSRGTAPQEHRRDLIQDWQMWKAYHCITTPDWCFPAGWPYRKSLFKSPDPSMPAVPAVMEAGQLEVVDAPQEEVQAEADEVLPVLEPRVSQGEFFNCGDQHCVTPSMCCGNEAGCFPPQWGCPKGTNITGPPSMLDFVLPAPTPATQVCDGQGLCHPIDN